MSSLANFERRLNVVCTIRCLFFSACRPSQVHGSRQIASKAERDGNFIFLNLVAKDVAGVCRSDWLELYSGTAGHFQARGGN